MHLSRCHDRFTKRPGTRAILALCGALMLAMVPTAALAHSGPPPVPETLWSTWNLDPLILLVLTAGTWAYLRGVRSIWARVGKNNGVSYWQVLAGVTGFLTIGIALISPLDPLSSALFSAHMAQHILLITIAPLLLILANVSAYSIWSLPEQWRHKIPGLWRGAGSLKAAWHLIARPLPALLIHSLVLWAWHVPVMYDAAVRNDLIHAIEHLTMFGSAMLFWWLVIQRGRQSGMSYGFGLLLVFGLVLQKTALGALITFSPSAWYTEYAISTAAWGLTPHEDQQLAGAILMGPGSVIYLIVGVTLFAGWLRAIERSVDRQEQFAMEGSQLEFKGSERTKETA